MKEALGVQIELSVQDCFLESSLAGLSLESSHDYSDRAIATETWEAWFDCWIEILHPDLPPAPSYEISLRLTNDTEIQMLNAQYRQQNKPTDVLAFAALEVFPQLLELRSLQPLCLGDIVISVDTAKQQAQQQGHCVSTELAWLAAHGLLHLLGWDHPDEDSLLEMLNQQTILLQTIGFAINTP